MSSSQQQRQQPSKRKFCPCKQSCGMMITSDSRFKNPDGTKFVPLEEHTNSVGEKTLQAHQCPKRQQQQQSRLQPQPQQQQQQHYDLSKEVTAIKAQLLVLISRLDHIEKELKTKND